MNPKHIRIFSVILYTLLVLPNVIYFIVCGYLWLFNGYNPDADRMSTTFVIGMMGTMVLFATLDMTRE